MNQNISLHEIQKTMDSVTSQNPQINASLDKRVNVCFPPLSREDIQSVVRFFEILNQINEREKVC
jgi:hypothetical protein